jgi:hypothetical protein
MTAYDVVRQTYDVVLTYDIVWLRCRTCYDIVCCDVVRS